MFIGAVLSLCNIYSGLKIGFTTNMSIAAALLAYGFYYVANKSVGSSKLGLQENILNETAASAAASIAGAGLVAAIPALTLLTGRELGFWALSGWALGVSVLGVWVGAGVRRQMLVVQELPFPYGIATATLLREMYGERAAALARIRALSAGIIVASGVKIAIEVFALPLFWLRGVVGTVGSKVVTLKNLGFALDPSLLMVGVGALIGLRSAVSMFGAAVVAWLLLGPWVLRQGWVETQALPDDTMWFTQLSGWLLWPGVALMVSAALTAFALSVPRLVKEASWWRVGGQPSARVTTPGELPRRVFWSVLIGLSVAVVCLQRHLFDIAWVPATVAVAVSFLLALVAGRVTGETGIAPIGAMGKVTQFLFALISPANPTANLMAANVTGGAASQCGDMLHDLKTGHLLGAWPRHQVSAQLFGVLAGAGAGSAGYLLLVPDPKVQLLTQEWPAPAVAQWRAVAELFTSGVSHLPPGAMSAVYWASSLGVLLSVLEKRAPASWRGRVPNAASMGLAFVLPAYYAASVLIGALLAAVAARFAPSAATRFTMVVASGVVAGESLTGVVFALSSMLGG